MASTLHWDVPRATRKSSAARRRPLRPEQENGQRLAGNADHPGITDERKATRGLRLNWLPAKHVL